MTEFAVSIAGFDSDDAKRRAARIIATSPGFYVSEDEAHQLLEGLPVSLAFETDAPAGEETIRSLRQAGCELSYQVVDSQHVEPVQKAQKQEYSDEQLERLERRFNRIPRTLVLLSIWFLVIAFIVFVPLDGVLIIGPRLLTIFTGLLFAVAAFMAKMEGWGYVLCVAASALGVLESAYRGGYEAIASSSHGGVSINVVPLMVFGIPFYLCLRLLLLLFKKPVRRWFS